MERQDRGGQCELAVAELLACAVDGCCGDGLTVVVLPNWWKGGYRMRVFGSLQVSESIWELSFLQFIPSDSSLYFVLLKMVKWEFCAPHVVGAKRSHQESLWGHIYLQIQQLTVRILVVFLAALSSTSVF